MPAVTPAILLLFFSIALQLLVAAAALRLIRVTGGRAAWVFIVTALCILVFRRVVILIALFSGRQFGLFSLLEELIAILSTLLFGAGIYFIRPVFYSVRKSEEEAKRKESRYRTLVEHLPQKVFLKDTNSVYISCNTNYADDLKVSPKEIVGKTDYEFYPHDLAEKYRADDKRVLESGETQTIEEPYLQNGRERIIHTVKTVVPDENGNIIGVLGIFWDITEQRWSEELIKKLNEHLQHRTQELEATNAELEAFSYSVSHDLRAPLRSIDGFSLALSEDYADKIDEQGQDYLRRIRAAAQRMGQLIDDLLKLSRVTRTEMRREPVNLSKLANSIIAELETYSPDRKIKFIAQPDIIANGDSDLLNIALENLLSNAWKFTGTRELSVIEFGSEIQGSERVYYVRDNGVGFDEAYIDKLFVAFQRLHSPTEFPGTGIGLALVKRIVNRHGGRVWASGQLDHGANFYFTLERQDNG